MLARTMRKDFIFEVASDLEITSNNIYGKIIVPHAPRRHYSSISAVHAGTCIDFDSDVAYGDSFDVSFLKRKV